MSLRGKEDHHWVLCKFYSKGKENQLTMLSSIIIQHLQDGNRVPRDGDEVVVPAAGASPFEGFDGSVHPSTQAADAVTG